MNSLSTLLILALFAAAREAEPPRPEMAHPSVQHNLGDSFLVPARPGTSESMLGRGYTRDLREIMSTGKVFGSVIKGKPRTTNSNVFKFDWLEVKDETQLGLSVGFFIVDVSAKARSKARFAILSVYQVDKVVSLDVGDQLPETEAELVPVEIWYGWSLNYLFEYQAKTTSDGVSLDLSVALSKVLGGKTGGDVDDVLSEFRAERSFVAIGLEQKAGGEIPIVTDIASIQKYFRIPQKQPQPIIVKYLSLKPFASPILKGRLRPRVPWKCEDNMAMKTMMDACTKALRDKVEKDAAVKGCWCLWNYVAERYRCNETPPASATVDACHSCFPNAPCIPFAPEDRSHAEPPQRPAKSW